MLWASSCDSEFTATLHREQYSSFLALSSSVSGWDGLLEAEAPASPESCGPDPGCSEPAVLPQPGEEEVRGTRGGVGAGRRGHAEATGESMGGVGDVGSEGSGPGAGRGSFNCDRGCVSSEKKNIPEGRIEINNKPDFTEQTFHKRNSNLLYYCFICVKQSHQIPPGDTIL